MPVFRAKSLTGSASLCLLGRVVVTTPVGGLAGEIAT